MADNQLRIVASLDDQVTNPMRKVKAEMAGLKAPPLLAEMGRDMRALNAGFRSIMPSISSFGIASLGVGGALSSVAYGIRTFAGQTQSLSIMSKELGISSDRIRALNEVGQRFGITADTMQGGLRQFAGSMEQIKDRWGDALGQLRDMRLSKLADDLASAPNMSAAIDRLFAGLANIPNAEKRRRVLNMLGLPEDWSNIVTAIPGKFKETVDEIEKLQGRIGKDTEKAAGEFEAGMSKMRSTADALRVGAIAPLLPAVNDLFAALNRADTFNFVKGEFDSVGVGVKSLIGEIKGAVDWLKTAKDAAGEFFGGSKTGGAVRNGIMPETSIGEAVANAEIAKRKLLADQARRSIDVQDEIINRKESRGEDATESRRKRDRLNDEIKRLADEIQALRRGGGGATKQDMSFGGVGPGGVGGLIHKAAFGGSGVPSSVEPEFSGGGGRSRGGSRTAPAGGAAEPDAGLQLRSGGGLTSNKQDRAMRLMARLVGHGWTPEAAATAAGQAQEESSFDPGGPGKRGGDGGKSHGLFQWQGPRLEALKRFADKRGKPWHDFDTQVDFFNEERKGRSAAERGWHRETDLGRGNRTGYLFERYAGPIQPQREGHARRLLETWKRRGGVPIPERVAPQDEPAGREGARPGPGQGVGDSMMNKAYGPGGVSTPALAPQKNEGTVNIHLSPGMQDARAKVDYDGLFTSVNVGRGNQLA